MAHFSFAIHEKRLNLVHLVVHLENGQRESNTSLRRIVPEWWLRPNPSVNRNAKIAYVKSILKQSSMTETRNFSSSLPTSIFQRCIKSHFHQLFHGQHQSMNLHMHIWSRPFCGNTSGTVKLNVNRRAELQNYQSEEVFPKTAYYFTSIKSVFVNARNDLPDGFLSNSFIIPEIIEAFYIQHLLNISWRQIFKASEESRCLDPLLINICFFLNKLPICAEVMCMICILLLTDNQLFVYPFRSFKNSLSMAVNVSMYVQL